jgi:glycolate oxidase FAD binding subunit
VLALHDVTPEIGFAGLRKIAQSALEPAGLAYLPGSMAPGAGQGSAFIRLEGASQPLEEKIALAHGLLGNAMTRFADTDPFPTIGNGEKFAGVNGDIWRVMIAPSDAPRVAKELNVAHWLGDLGGGLLWLAAPTTDAPRIRQIAAAAQGQAMLLRASAQTRAAIWSLRAPAARLWRRWAAASKPRSIPCRCSIRGVCK